MIFTALSFYGLFTAYFLYEEVMSVRLYVNEYRRLKKVAYQIDRTVAPFNKFCGKIWVGFCLNTGKRLFLEVSI